MRPPVRRRRRLRLRDIPHLLILSTVQFAHLFSGRYGRVEGAHVLARDGDRRYLVVRTTYLDPGWGLPGGRVERRETPEAAAARETQEETGVSVEVGRLRLVDTRRSYGVSFVFDAAVTGGRLEPQLGEIAEAGWLTRAEIDETSPRLSRLLEIIDAAGDGVAYVGVNSDPSAIGGGRA
jgi:ADP-ribose pyrophosphatase YjhB (NUDIX family)